LLAFLKSNGVDCVVALPKSSPYAGRYHDAGASTAFVRAARIRRSINPIVWAGFAANLAMGVQSLGSVIENSGADLVHVNMETAVAGPIAAKLRRVPCVVHVRSTSIARPAPVFKAFVAFLSRYSDRVVAISNAVRDLMISGGFPESRIDTIYDPIDVGKFRPRSANEKNILREKIIAPLGVPDGAPILGLIGRMNPIKGQDVFLEGGGDRRKRIQGRAFPAGRRPRRTTPSAHTRPDFANSRPTSEFRIECA